MNVENINKAIAIMERVPQGRLRMTAWQCGDHGWDTLPVRTEEELHACGNKACFAGYVAISPEWKADGGEVCANGAPVILTKEYPPPPIRVLTGTHAIAYWLDISRDLAAALVTGHLTEIGRTDPYSHSYKKRWADVEPADVIEKLLSIKEGRL